MNKKIRVFTGNSNPQIAREICDFLGIPLGKAEVGAFSDGECSVEIHESVRGMQVFVIQSTSPPVNDNLMELLVMIDALKRASSEEITAVIPYYGYARQDKKVFPRAPITAKLVADLLIAAGTQRVISMELHAGQIQGFFNIPVDHLYSSPVMLEYLKDKFGKDMIIVSPDAGGVERARAYAQRLGVGLAIIDKRRQGPNVAEVMHIIGDVKSRNAVILDDMVDTAGTLVKAAEALKDNGANNVYGVLTHPVLSGPAVDRINKSPIEEIIVSNTIPLNKEAKKSGKIKVLKVSKLFGEAIKRIHKRKSVSELFYKNQKQKR
ncbi:MAG: ribose-phosphate pyrophosphokinase [Deltaproteobacteria bacterium]|uniref:Ribose-phosphate pyrophosphokinase n=1 Tax=Candidatus Zymogenus saltonus TaxID=2844893 RepID=A0A9D8KDN5_9DELT|nr:ribose-phosphate pyrophosphokinase [Candidatus Zymogenus saltonus]